MTKSITAPPTHQQAVGRFGGLIRSRPADDPELCAVRELVISGRAEIAIRRALADRPMFTAQQVKSLKALLISCGGQA